MLPLVPYQIFKLTKTQKEQQKRIEKGLIALIMVILSFLS